MHRSSLAGPRRRTRRAVLAAALPAVIATAALPAAASAATVETSSDNSRIIYRGAGGENNSLNISSIGAGIEIKDFAGLTERSGICSQVSASTVRCASVSAIDAFLGDRNDSTSIRVPTQVFVDGGAGDDTFAAGASPTATQVDYRGGIGFDRMSYTVATRGVIVSNDNVNNDGRTLVDRDDVGSDIERLIGSRLNDTLVDAGATCCATTLSGGLGDDILRGAPRNGRTTVFDMGPVADGADTVIIPNTTFSHLDYSDRTRPVTVTAGFGPRNGDGEAGEGDDIVYQGGALQIDGGSAGDTLSSFGSVLTNQSMFLRGNDGIDRLEGGEGSETFDGGPGFDTYIANGGNDSVNARDGVSDTVGCGPGANDTAQLDASDVSGGCEARFVGVLRLSPKTIRATAGETVRARLSWRHPRSWKQLRTIELRLTREGAPIGEITIRPRGERISAEGGVQLVRKHTRLARNGKAVTARLALRSDKSLAGQTLKAEVEATDTRGRRQLEHDAGTVRVVE